MRLGIVVGSCRSQAVTEALAELVALRAWFPTMFQGKTTIVVRLESQAALGALARLSGCPRPARLSDAREGPRVAR